jgi:cyclophilin family peptidyl-prolyl cis-trans isomerase
VQEKTGFLEDGSLATTIIMNLKSGPVKIELRPDLAPNHVTRITELTKDGFYDGIVFHRVIPGFMAQTGDPTGTGTGGSKKPNLKAEFSRERHVRGTCSMARSGSPDSANSQFFICFDDAPWLDGNYTVWGKVVEGMEHIDAIKKGDSGDNGSVANPDKIISMTLP